MGDTAHLVKVAGGEVRPQTSHGMADSVLRRPARDLPERPSVVAARVAHVGGKPQSFAPARTLSLPLMVAPIVRVAHSTGGTAPADGADPVRYGLPSWRPGKHPSGRTRKSHIAV